jgi:hypothetical protein
MWISISTEALISTATTSTTGGKIFRETLGDETDLVQAPGVTGRARELGETGRVQERIGLGQERIGLGQA